MAVTLTVSDMIAALSLPTEPADALAASTTLATRLLDVVTDEITRYCPDAPPSTANEAAIRMAGFLEDSRGTSALQEVKVGDAVDLTFRSTAVSALRTSGGMALLSPFKIRRAGICAVVAS